MALFRKNKGTRQVDQMAKQELRELAERVDAMVEAADEASKPWLEMADDALHYVCVDQLRGMKFKGGWDRIEMNYFLPALMQTLALVSQQDVTILGEPVEDSDKQTSEAANGYLKHLFERVLDIPRARLEWIMDGFIVGTWAAYVEWDDRPLDGWNNEKREYEGRPRIVLLRAEDYGVNPNCEKETLSDAENAFVREHMPIDEAKRRWPGNDDAIEAEAQRQMAKHRDEQTMHGVIVTSAGELSTNDGGAVKQGDKDVGPGTGMFGRLADQLYRADPHYIRRDGKTDLPSHVVVTRIWFRDREMVVEETSTPIPIEQLVADGRIAENDMHMWAFTDTGEELTMENHPQTVEKKEVPRYPHGRYVERLGDLILNPDVEDQIWGAREWPLMTGRFKILPHTWRGMNGVESARANQDFVNQCAMSMLVHLRKHADPLVFVDQDAIANIRTADDIPQRIRSGPGRVVVTRPGKARTGIQVVTPPPFSDSLIRLMSLMISEIRNQTAIHEIVQGIQSKGEMTASEALRLETNSRLGIALLLRNVDSFTVRVMELVFKLVKQHVAAGDVVRVLGEEKREAAYAVMEGDFDIELDIKLQVGTALPFDEERKKMEALQLYNILGPPFLKRLLEAFKQGNIQELLQQTDAWVAIQEELQAEGVEAGDGEQNVDQQAPGMSPDQQQMANVGDMFGAGTGIPKDFGGMR